ncbi:MAG TPA: helicase-related protein [Acidimicrobiales bacterium]|nr:helicase-related protein [Acidimicrobiales bacterium]
MSARLEDLVPGAVIGGILPARDVTAVALSWHGSSAVTLTYRDPDGRVGERLLYRSDEQALAVRGTGSRFRFDADGELFTLVSEARRIRLAHLFDPLLAVHLSLVEPLPHQIRAVYGELLPRQPLRFVLADDPGAGKTIMAGLYIKELLLRSDVARCLVVAPGGLVAQWQDELAEKFGLDFEILTRDAIEASRTGNPLAERDLVIARLDHLSRNDDIQERLKATEWDLVVVDEAHRMSAHYEGDDVRETRRYRLGKLLASTTRHLLLLTATPHAGKDEDFQLFLALLDADRFEGRRRSASGQIDATDLMRRMVKEKLLRFDGRPLFPERRAYTVPFELSAAEQDLYEAVTTYVREEMNRAERLASGRRTVVGFALTVLQRRLASSPEAIYQSLARRRKRLEDHLAELRARSAGFLEPGTGAELARLGLGVEDLDAASFDDGDLDAAELEEAEERLVDEASAAETAAELEAEIATLAHLESLARGVLAAGDDRKWTELAGLLAEGQEMFSASGARRKLLIFTEHRDTLNYLVRRLEGFLGRPEAVASIHGGMRREQRRAAQEAFTSDPDCVVLVATDAAGEGINLQRAHLVVNYDLPWNPNRIEQRFGRVHRIGQEEVCHMWNLVAAGTREGQVYELLLRKLDEQRQALGGQVFDVLGRAMPGRTLRDLLIEAIRYGERPDVRAHLQEVIDAHVGEGIGELIAEEALASEVLSEADLTRLRLQMEEAAARRLQPHYVHAFFERALSALGGRLVEREPERYEVTHVPAEVRSATVRSGRSVLRRYERICFDKALIHQPGRPPAELVAPGHPLLDAVVALTIERHGSLLSSGAVLIDDADPSEIPRVLCYLEHTITDARPGPGEADHVVSRRFEFVSIDRAGTGSPGGWAPYLDYRAASPDELAITKRILAEDWLSAPDLERRALDYAIEHIVPAHLAEVSARVDERVERTMAAVRARLTREINYWDQRAAVLKEQAAQGRQPKMNPERAQARADELAGRLERRLAELEEERRLQALPPVLVGAALVIPAGLLAALGDPGAASTSHLARETRAIEERAMRAVLEVEARLGRHAEAMPHANPGFDIRSIDTGGHLLLIEVKGRIEGSTTVSVTRNEILTGLNAADHYLLALVEVRGDDTCEVRYLYNPFAGKSRQLHFAERSTTFDWEMLWDVAEAPR